jgi:hypothetical protein
VTANEITKDLLLALPKRFPLSWHWRSNRIDANAVGRGGRTRRVQAGINGQADITGVMGVRYLGKLFGVRTELEIKTTDRQSAIQKAFQIALERVGGIYVLTHGVDECLNKLAFIVDELERPL